MEPREVEKKKKKNTGGIIAIVIFLAFVVGIIIFLVNLFNEKTTYTTADDQVTETTSLYCTTESKNIDGAFFDLSDSESAKQAIKVIFKNKKIDNIAYNADINYTDNKKAVNREAELNVKYGLYMQDNGREMTDFSPNFSVNDTNVKISLFATMKQLNSVFAKIFLIDTNDSLSSYSPKVLSTLYNTKGFKCEIKE